MHKLLDSFHSITYILTSISTDKNAKYLQQLFNKKQKDITETKNSTLHSLGESNTLFSQIKMRQRTNIFHRLAFDKVEFPFLNQSEEIKMLPSFDKHS